MKEGPPTPAKKWTTQLFSDGLVKIFLSYQFAGIGPAMALFLCSYVSPPLLFTILKFLKTLKDRKAGGLARTNQTTHNIYPISIIYAMNPFLRLRLALSRRHSPAQDFRHPFDGWPDSWAINGGWRIYARHLTATRAKMIKYTRDGLLLLASAGFFMLYSDKIAPLGVFLMIFCAVLWLGAKELLLKHTTIDMVYGALSVNNGRPYNLNIPHQFDMIPHPKRIPTEFRNRTQGGVPLRTFFDNSFIIRFHYAGTPITLIEVYDETNAYEMLARLQAIDQILQKKPKEERKRKRAGG